MDSFYFYCCWLWRRGGAAGLAKIRLAYNELCTVQQILFQMLTAYIVHMRAKQIEWYDYGRVHSVHSGTYRRTAFIYCCYLYCNKTLFGLRYGSSLHRIIFFLLLVCATHIFYHSLCALEHKKRVREWETEREEKRKNICMITISHTSYIHEHHMHSSCYSEALFISSAIIEIVYREWVFAMHTRWFFFYLFCWSEWKNHTLLMIMVMIMMSIFV